MWADPNVMAALPNIGGALCCTPQSLTDAQCSTAVHVTFSIQENARLGRKVNFAHDKIPLGAWNPRKCTYSVSAHEMAKHLAKFGSPLLSKVGTVTKPIRETR